MFIKDKAKVASRVGCSERRVVNFRKLLFKFTVLSSTSFHVDSSETSARLPSRSVDPPVRRQSRDPRVNFKSTYGRFPVQSSDVHMMSRSSDATKHDARVSLAALYGLCRDPRHLCRLDTRHLSKMFCFSSKFECCMELC